MGWLGLNPGGKVPDGGAVNAGGGGDMPTGEGAMAGSACARIRYGGFRADPKGWGDELDWVTLGKLGTPESLMGEACGNAPSQLLLLSIIGTLGNAKPAGWAMRWLGGKDVQRIINKAIVNGAWILNGPCMISSSKHYLMIYRKSR